MSELDVVNTFSEPGRHISPSGYFKQRCVREVDEPCAKGRLRRKRQRGWLGE